MISEGLKGDERVVTTAGAFLRAGDEVVDVDAQPHARRSLKPANQP